jgi:MFS family permease
MAFADLLPVVLIGPLAGVWVDRPLRKLLMRWCQSIMLVQSLVLFALAASGSIDIWLLFFLVLINGIVSAIYHPVRLSVVPSLVNSADLLAAVSLTAVTFHLSRFAGPALAGICMSLYGIPATFLMVAFSYAVMLVAVFTLKIPGRPWLEGLQKRSLLAELRDGMAYVLSHRAIAYILLIQTILALFARPLGELMPAFVGSVFEAGPGMLAVLTSTMGIGAVAGGLRLLLWDVDRGLPGLIIWSTAFSGITVILFALTPNIWIGAVILFFVAYWVTVCGIASQTLIQTCVDESKRGRVLSMWAAIYRGAPGVGALLIGWAAGTYGLIWPNILAASICVLGAAWMTRKKPLLDAAIR